MSRSFRSYAVLAHILLMAAPAQADDEPSLPSIALIRSNQAETVTFGDLDLESSAGRNELHRRVLAAASQICQRDALRQLRRNCQAGILAHVIATASPSLRAALKQADDHGR
jgi:UrcA family protein